MILLDDNTYPEKIIEELEDLEELKYYFGLAMENSKSLPKDAPTREQVMSMSREDMLNYYWSLDHWNNEDADLIGSIVVNLNTPWKRRFNN